ncbi:MAG: glutathione binding-like protein, partial [Psychrobacter sp.]|nr:glutathione binding-like protein [Psychrobacter sp.]
ARPVTGTIKKAIDRQYLNLTIAEQMMMVDAALAQRDYLAGEALTAADILMAFLLQALAVSMPNFTQYRHVVEYLTTLQAGEAYQNAQTKGKFNDDEFTRYWANTW